MATTIVVTLDAVQRPGDEGANAASTLSATRPRGTRLRGKTRDRSGGGPASAVGAGFWCRFEPAEHAPAVRVAPLANEAAGVRVAVVGEGIEAGGDEGGGQLEAAVPSMQRRQAAQVELCSNFVDEG